MFYGSVGDGRGDIDTATNSAYVNSRNRTRHVYGNESNELTKILDEQNKLITISMQQNKSLVKLCEDMKDDVSKLRKEVSDLKESFTNMNSKAPPAKKYRKKLPTDLTVRLKVLNYCLHYFTFRNVYGIYMVV